MRRYYLDQNAPVREGAQTKPVREGVQTKPVREGVQTKPVREGVQTKKMGRPSVLRCLSVGEAIK